MKKITQFTLTALISSAMLTAVAGDWDPVVDFKDPQLINALHHLKGGDVVSVPTQFGTVWSNNRCTGLVGGQAYDFPISMTISSEMARLSREETSIEIDEDEIYWNNAPENAICLHFKFNLGKRHIEESTLLSQQVIDERIKKK